MPRSSGATKLSGGLKNYPLAESLVTSTRLVIDSTVRWERQFPAKMKCSLTVTGAPDGTRVEMVVLESEPSEPRVTYIHPDGWIRRLCMNRKHGAIQGTHKHCIRPGGVEGAYEPSDIPEVPLSPYVRAGVHREIMEAFIAECNIVLGPGYVWSDPYPVEGVQ